MRAAAFDHLPLSAHMVQRVTHSRPAVTITAPLPEQHCVPYDIASDANRDAYLAQSAATREGTVAPFSLTPAHAPRGPADVAPSND